MTVQDIVLEFPNNSMSFSEMSTEQRDADSKYAADKICEAMELEIKKTLVDKNGLKQYLLGNVGEEESQLAIYWSQYTGNTWSSYLCIGLSYNESPCGTGVASSEFEHTIKFVTREYANRFHGLKIVKNAKGNLFFLYIYSDYKDTIIGMKEQLAATSPNYFNFLKIDNVIYKHYSTSLYRRYPGTTVEGIGWNGCLNSPLINTYKYNYLFPLQNGFTNEEFQDCFYLGTAKKYSTLEKILIDGKKYFIFERVSSNHYYIALDEAGV